MRFRRRLPWMYIGVMAGIYTVCRLGKADTLTDDTRRILGREPARFEEFARDHRNAWRRGFER